MLSTEAEGEVDNILRDLLNSSYPKKAEFINPFAPGDFAEKRVFKLVEWFSGHCRAIKS